MPAVLTHKTIMLMARERLKTIHDQLNAKLLRAGAKTDLEHRVMWLADTAYKMMSDTTLAQRGVIFPEGAVYATPLGLGVSPYSVMGSMGPDITAFSALFARGQGWVFDTVHKGNPDENREPVVARTTDFAIEFWNQISNHRAANPPRATDGDMANMRAYVLGHLCHVAGDVISHPFIHDLEWHLGNQSRAKFSHAGGEASLDAAVAQRLLLRRSTREGQDWDKWWPTRDEVPEVFFAAYTETLDMLYQARSAEQRPKGFGDFEQKFLDRKPPPLTVDFIKDGYHLYRHGILSIGYGWSYGNWFGMLTPMIVPLSLAIALSGALPHSRDFFTHELSEVGERAWFEIVTLPLAVGTIIPIIYGAWAASLSTKGIEGLTGSGLAFAILNFIAAVAFFATVGVSDQDLPPWVRWVFLFGPLVSIPLVFTIIGAANLGRDAAKMQGGLALGVYGLPFIIWAAFMVIFLIVVAGLGSLASFLANKAADESHSNAGDILGVIFYVLGMLIFSAILIAIWIIAPKKLRDAKIPELPKPFPADRPHYVRLFDDSTLGHDPAQNAPTARQLFYPSARRPLLKLWWNGAADLYVRSEQRQLVFATNEAGTAGRVVVPAPVVPVTVQDLKVYLETQVTNLKAIVVFPGDAAKETFLPTGALFSEDIDEDEEEKGYPDDVAKFTKLKKAEGDAAYVLRHADKPYQAIRFGQRGPVAVGNPQEELVPGPGKVTSAGTTVTGTGTMFGFLFDVGDQIAVANSARVVTQIHSDTSLEISAPFDPNVTNADKYLRLGPNDELSPGPGTLTSDDEEVTGTGTRFRGYFSPGDFILVGHQLREVVAIASDTRLTVADEFDSDLDGAIYSRIASRQERLEGYRYVAAATGVAAVDGDTVMDFAADFAALLCMGMAPHLLPVERRTVPSLAGAHAAAGGAAVDPAVAKVYQVFRNWSLDRRRLNEWRMLVAGGARTEKGAAADYDAAMPNPQPPEADWKGDRVVTAGEPTANAEGWVPVLRQWLSRVTQTNVANPAAADATNAAVPAGAQASNLQLSQALAFLLDLKAPTNLAP